MFDWGCGATNGQPPFWFQAVDKMAHSATSNQGYLGGHFVVVSRLSAFGRNIAKADVQLSGLCSTMCHWPRHDKRMRDQFPTASRSQRAALRHLVAALLQQRGQMAVGLCRPPPPWPSRCPPSDVRAGLRSRTAQTRPAFAERRYQPGWNPGSRPSPITPRPSRGKLDRYAIPRV